MKDFCIELEKNAEGLARIGEILGAARVNIEGLCIIAKGECSLVHLAIEDASTARNALEVEGITIKDEVEVFVLAKDQKKITGKPGSFGEICRALAGHGVKIDFGYAAENNRFFFGVNDVVKTKELLA